MGSLRARACDPGIMNGDPPNSPNEADAASWPKVVHQHVHDVRNHLFGLDLDVTLISELSADPEITRAAARLRGHLAELEETVQNLLARFPV